MNQLFKKVLSTIASITSCFSLLFCAACDTTAPADPVVPEKIHDYCIYTDGTVFAQAEIGQSYSIATPEVIDRSGAKVSGFLVKAKSVLDPRGKEVALYGGKIFLPEILGDYTVTFYCPDYEAVKETSTLITCIDTRGPIIDVSALRSFMFVSETVTVPEFDAIDRDGIDASSKKVSLINSDGHEIVPEDGVYNDLQEGYYTFQFFVKDNNGNASTASKTVYFSSQEQVEDKLTYFSESEYSKLISKYDANPLPNLGWNPEKKTPDGEESLELSVTKDGTYALSFAVTCAITDWSEYDAFGVWVYNPTDVHLAVGLLGVNDMDRGELNPKSWNYVVRRTQDSLYDAKKVVHNRKEYSQIVFSIYDVFVKDGMETSRMLNTTDKFLFGNVQMLKEDKDLVYGLGESYAMKYIAFHQKYMDILVETATDYVFPGDSCSLKLTMTENTIHSFNMGIQYPVQFNSDNPRYLLNVYNPNAYDIVIIDCPCDLPGLQRGENCTENFSTTVKAKSTAKVLVQADPSVSQRYAYIMALKTDGSYVDKDFSIYLGNVRASDNYTDDYTKWTSENGDADIWLKYQNKLKERG